MKHRRRTVARYVKQREREQRPPRSRHRRVAASLALGAAAALTVTVAHAQSSGPTLFEASPSSTSPASAGGEPSAGSGAAAMDAAGARAVPLPADPSSTSQSKMPGDQRMITSAATGPSTPDAQGSLLSTEAPDAGQTDFRGQLYWTVDNPADPAFNQVSIPSNRRDSG
jgi:hypothetical protein